VSVLDKNCFEILDYSGAGYQPLVYFGAWRVAKLRYLDGIHPDNNGQLERHTKTDEVFVLFRVERFLDGGIDSADFINLTNNTQCLLVGGIIIPLKNNQYP